MSFSQVVDKTVDSFSPESVWDVLKGNLKGKVSPFIYNNWFRPISNGRVESDRFIITVPNKFISDWITDYYVELLEKEVTSLVQKPLKVGFEIREGEPQEELAETAVDANTGTSPSAGPTSSAASISESAPVQVEKPYHQNFAPLNPKYTFETFVPGPSNQLAHAAARSVAELPGGHYNPLFIYGGVGLGKTHLLNAIGLEVSKRNPHFKILYLPAEKFMNEFIHSVRNDRMALFRKKYRETCDLLLIDDIQFLGGKESTQDEFFHTFNALHDLHRQIVMTSDKAPKDIPGLEERLCSRFEWGLVADIQTPDLETRMAILKKKCEKDGIPVNDEIALYLASNVKSNVRELEGSLVRLNAFASLTGSYITMDLCKEVMKKGQPASKAERQNSIETIQQIVAEYYQIQIADLRSQRRMKGFAYPRQIAMYLCKKHLKVSFPEIGSRFGGKDHTTVMHACRKIESLLEQDTSLQNDIAILEQSILQ